MGHPGCLRPDGLERNSKSFGLSKTHPNLAQNARLGWGTRAAYGLTGWRETPKSFGLRKSPP
jgi:hypothetical protein